MRDARKRNVAAVLLGVFLMAACTAEDPPEKPKGCIENMPESIPGLKAEGPRPAKNIIAYMWPITCNAQARYRQRLKENPELKGVMEISLVVEFNGEVGAFSIVRDTLNDPEVKKKVLSMIRYLGFDAYGPRNSETEIVYPIRFKP